MHPIRWIPGDATSNSTLAATLANFSATRTINPALRLSGVEVNPAALEQARLNLPTADLRDGLPKRCHFQTQTLIA